MLFQFCPKFELAIRDIHVLNTGKQNGEHENKTEKTLRLFSDTMARNRAAIIRMPDAAPCAFFAWAPFSMFFLTFACPRKYSTLLLEQCLCTVARRYSNLAEANHPTHNGTIGNELSPGPAPSAVIPSRGSECQVNIRHRNAHQRMCFVCRENT